MRSELIAALAACSEGPRQSKARRFLGGLSSDELQFIASFVGARILEPKEEVRVGNAGGYGNRAEDRDLKMILVMEFLYRSGFDPTLLRAFPGSQPHAA